MLRTLGQTGPRKARAATANIAPRTAPRTAPRGLGWAAWADNPASRSGAADAKAADHMTAPMTSSTALRPRTSQGSEAAPAAHRTAPSSTPTVSIGPTTWLALLPREPSHTARAGTPDG